MGVVFVIIIGGLVLLGLLLGVMSASSKSRHPNKPNDMDPNRDLEAMRYKHHSNPMNKHTRFKK